VSLEPGTSHEPLSCDQERSGRFVFVVGPSGAGKDTLIAGAVQQLSHDDRFHFIQRTVTRPSGSWEDHHSLSEEAFTEAEASGRFAFTWSAHGLRYGVPVAAKQLVRDGKIVVCNGSRGAIADALALFACMDVVLITAARDVRLRRLLARARERDVTRRIDRHAEWESHSVASLIIDNNGEPEEAIAAFVEYLRAVASH
jgi:ribose 1,5-bisphosphokinase